MSSSGRPSQCGVPKKALALASVGLFFFAVLVEVLTGSARDLISFEGYLRAFGLFHVVFIFPFFVNRQFSTVLVPTALVGTAVLGFLLPASILLWLSGACALIGLLALISTIREVLAQRQFSALLPVFFLFIISYSFLYSVGYHDLRILKEVIAANTHLDIAFHGSISESIITHGVASTSLDGSPYIHYHWGSHFIQGGLSRWCGTSSLAFYNLLYPALVVPLFIGALYQLTARVADVMQWRLPSPWPFSATLIVLYTLPLDIITTNFQPFISESYCYSLFFFFAGLEFLLQSMTYKTDRRPLWATVGTLIVLTYFITLCKISTGFVAAGVFFLLAWWKLPRRYAIACLPFAVGLASLVILHIFPTARQTYTASVFDRINNLLIFQEGPIYTFLAPLVLIVFARVAGKFPYGSRAALSLQRNDWLSIALVILATWLLSWVGAMAVSAYRSDVFYFSSVQVFVALPLVLLLAEKFLRWLAGHRTTVIAAGCLLLTFLAYPRWAKPYVDVVQEVKSALPVADLLLRKQLFRTLTELDISEAEKRFTAIYVPQNQVWFYDRQDSLYRTPMLVTALTGLPFVGAIPREVLERKSNYYSIYYYRNPVTYPPRNEEEAVARARKQGKKKLLVFREEAGTLVRRDLVIAE